LVGAGTLALLLAGLEKIVNETVPLRAPSGRLLHIYFNRCVNRVGEMGARKFVGEIPKWEFTRSYVERWTFPG
jgi:hypothetical protein